MILGPFIFGTDSPVVEGDGEEPAREVNISKDYYMDAYEVSNSEFWIFTKETKYKTEGKMHEHEYQQESEPAILTRNFYSQLFTHNLFIFY